MGAETGFARELKALLRLQKLRRRSGDGSSQPSSDRALGHALTERGEHQVAVRRSPAGPCRTGWGLQGAGRGHRLPLVTSQAAWPHTPHRPSSPQATAPCKGGCSCRCHFGVIHPVLGLGKQPLHRGEAHPSCPLPHTELPPHGSWQQSL